MSFFLWTNEKEGECFTCRATFKYSSHGYHWARKNLCTSCHEEAYSLLNEKILDFIEGELDNWGKTRRKKVGIKAE